MGTNAPLRSVNRWLYSFGPPSVARMPRAHLSSAESTSHELSKDGSRRFAVAESIQPVVDVDEVRARIRRPRRYVRVGR